MKSVEATLTSKGQVIVPAPLRKALGLKAGDKLVFKQDAKGRYFIEARTEALADLRGSVGRAACDPIAPVDSARIARWIEESRAGSWSGMRDTSEDGEA